MSSWEFYTERARRVIVLAREEAARLGCRFIGTEHLLLGLLSEGDSVASKFLNEQGLTLKNVRLEVEAIVGRVVLDASLTELTFTPRLNKVFEKAFKFKEMQYPVVIHLGTEHLLMGLLQEEEGIAARIFTNLGKSLPHLRLQLRYLLESSLNKSKGNITENPVVAATSTIKSSNWMKILSKQEVEDLTYWLAKASEELNKSTNNKYIVDELNKLIKHLE